MYPFSVREARRSDLESVVELWREMMSAHAALDARFTFVADADAAFAKHVRSMLRTTGARILVADVGGLVVGYVMAEMQARLPIYPAGRYGFISDICVTERYRRRGIGRALAERAVRWCSGEGATSVELFAAERNPVSGAFWSAMGFGPYLRMLRMDVDDALRRGRP